MTVGELGGWTQLRSLDYSNDINLRWLVGCKLPDGKCWANTPRKMFQNHGYTRKKTARHKVYHQGPETHVESSWSFTLQNLHDSIKGSCIVLSSTTHIISHTSFQGLNGCHSQNSFRNSTTGTSQHAFRNGQLALIILENWESGPVGGLAVNPRLVWRRDDGPQVLNTESQESCDVTNRNFDSYIKSIWVHTNWKPMQQTCILQGKKTDLFQFPLFSLNMAQSPS